MNELKIRDKITSYLELGIQIIILEMMIEPSTGTLLSQNHFSKIPIS